MTFQYAALPRTETLLNPACDPAHSRCMRAAAAPAQLAAAPAQLAAAPARSAGANEKSGARASFALA